MKKIGSKTRETLKEAGFELVERKGKAVVLKDVKTLNLELWSQNNDYAGYVIEINNVGYEFISNLS